jgi:hypothetical protein
VTAPAVTPSPTPPGSDTQKHAAIKPVRPVIPIRRAGIWIIRVVAPLADRRTVNSRRRN